MAAGLVLGLGPAAPAQDPDSEGVIALVGGQVRPADGPAIRGGTVLIRDGVIEAVGAEVAVPSGARVIDCAGKVVTPGLVDADSALGLAAADRTSSRVYADYLAADAFDPWDERLATARRQGVTCLHLTGSTRAPVGGSSAVVSTAASSGSVLVQAGAVALNLSSADNSSGLWGASRLASLRATLVSVRDRIASVDRWRRDLEAYEEKRLAEEPTKEERLLLPDELLDEMRKWSPSQRVGWRKGAYKSMKREKEYEAPKKPDSAPKRPRRDPHRETLASLVGAGKEGGRRALLRTELGGDVEAALALVREFELDPVLAGGAGLLDHAESLAKRRVPVVVTHLADTTARERGPLTRRPAGLVAELVAQKLRPALGSGDVAGGSRWLRLLAAREIGEGLGARAALRSVTIWAAEAAGVADRVGSITAGKRADVVVWSGDPFSAATRAEVVIIGGEVDAE